MSYATVLRDGRPDGTVVVARTAAGNLARVERNGAYRFSPENGAPAEVKVVDVPAPLEVGGPWQLHFPPHRDAPAAVELPRLISWTEHANAAIKYFSGTATYTHAVTIPEGALRSDRRVMLELGRVEVIAEVSVNGQPVGVAWLPPYRIDVTGALHSGTNELTVKVTNLWKNRIAGDFKYPDGFPGGPRPKEFKTEMLDSSRFKATDPLVVSGLLGPVRLVTEESVPIPAEP